MSQRLSQREGKRRNQRDYEKRLRAGVGMYLVPLTHHEIDDLVSLNYLPEGAESDRKAVGEAAACLLRQASISLKRSS